MPDYAKRFSLIPNEGVKESSVEATKAGTMTEKDFYLSSDGLQKRGGKSRISNFKRSR